MSSNPSTSSAFVLCNPDGTFSCVSESTPPPDRQHAILGPLVRCPSCHQVLRTPVGAPVFACPCGARLAAPLNPAPNAESVTPSPSPGHAALNPQRGFHPILHSAVPLPAMDATTTGPTKDFAPQPTPAESRDATGTAPLSGPICTDSAHLVPRTVALGPAVALPQAPGGVRPPGSYAPHSAPPRPVPHQAYYALPQHPHHSHYTIAILPAALQHPPYFATAAPLAPHHLCGPPGPPPPGLVQSPAATENSHPHGHHHPQYAAASFPAYQPCYPAGPTPPAVHTHHQLPPLAPGTRYVRCTRCHTLLSSSTAITVCGVCNLRFEGDGAPLIRTPSAPTRPDPRPGT